MSLNHPTKARSNLTAWLKKAAAGEDIGILFGDKVIALRPVEVEAKDDYARTEYGMTKKDMDRFAEKMDAKVKRDRKAGKTLVYNGDLEALIKG